MGGLTLLGVGKAAAVVVPNPVEWLEADTLALSDGDPVGTWTAIAGNDATQGTAAAKPTWRLTGGPNGLPSVEFDAVDDRLLITFPSLTTSVTMMLVLKAATDSADRTPWEFQNAGLDSHYAFGDGNIYDGAFSTLRKTVGNPSPALTAWRIYEVRSAANDWEARLDGTSLFSTGTNTFGAPGASTSIGSSNNPNKWWGGHFSALKFWCPALTPAEASAARAALGAKYAITVA